MRQISLEEVQAEIIQECDEIKELLLAKNKSYGNAAIDPKRIFSKASPISQLQVRIDDKLSRIMNNSEESFGEDTTKDLIGYLVLLRIAIKLSKQEQISTDVLEDLDSVSFNNEGGYEYDDQ